MDEEEEHSPSVFYYPEDLETFDAETETGIKECHIINNLLTELTNSTVMQTLDIVSGLHNCLEFSQPLSCLYQAMQTRKTFSVA